MITDGIRWDETEKKERKGKERTPEIKVEMSESVKREKNKGEAEE